MSQIPKAKSNLPKPSLAQVATATGSQLDLLAGRSEQNIARYRRRYLDRVQVISCLTAVFNSMIVNYGQLGISIELWIPTSDCSLFMHFL